MDHLAGRRWFKLGVLMMGVYWRAMPTRNLPQPSSERRAGKQLLILFVAVLALLVAAELVLGWRPRLGSTGVATPRSAATSRAARSESDAKLIDDYIRTHSVRKLQLGAGPNNLPGWLNTDIEPAAGQAYLDAKQRWPLPDASFQYVFAEQLIEHLPYAQGKYMLSECRRVLTDGGKVRIATPDLRKIVDLFQTPPSDEAQRFMKLQVAADHWPSDPSPEAFIMNYFLRSWGHQFIYDKKILRAALEAAGFRTIIEEQPRQSRDPVLANIDSHHTNIETYHKGAGIPVNDYVTMVFEATR